MTVDWYPLGSNCSTPTSRNVDIFFDRWVPGQELSISDRFFPGRNLLDEENVAMEEFASDSPPKYPIFRFNSSGRCGRDTLKSSFSTFRTKIKLVGDFKSQNSPSPSLQDYPFDRWHRYKISRVTWHDASRYLAQISMFAQDSTSNASITILSGKPFGIPMWAFGSHVHPSTYYC